MAIISFPIATLWLFTEPILILLGQDPEISKLSSEFTFFMIPGLFPMLAYYCIMK